MHSFMFKEITIIVQFVYIILWVFFSVCMPENNTSVGVLDCQIFRIRQSFVTERGVGHCNFLYFCCELRFE